MSIKENTWVVYRHTSPSKKCYIGITHYKNPEKRWGKNGSNYSENTVFYKAIKKYGWDNIIHEILHINCSEEEAKTLEKLYIFYYKALGLSYNMTVGGEGHNFGKNSQSKEYKTEQSKKFRKENPNYDKEQYQKHKEKRIKKAREYYYNNREKVLEYKKSEEVKKKARERAAKWRKEHPNYMKEYMVEYNKNKKTYVQDSSAR